MVVSLKHETTVKPCVLPAYRREYGVCVLNCSAVKRIGTVRGKIRLVSHKVSHMVSQITKLRLVFTQRTRLQPCNVLLNHFFLSLIHVPKFLASWDWRRTAVNVTMCGPL
jgi:hypothetical protein